MSYIINVCICISWVDSPVDPISVYSQFASSQRLIVWQAKQNINIRVRLHNVILNNSILLSNIQYGKILNTFTNAFFKGAILKYITILIIIPNNSDGFSPRYWYNKYMELSILYFNMPNVFLSLKIGFYLSKHCRPWLNAPLSSGSSLSAKVPVYQYPELKGLIEVGVLISNTNL